MIVRNVGRALIAVFVIVALVAGSSSGARAEAKAPVIAVVDVLFILHESTAGKGIQKAIDAQRESFNKDIAKLRQAEQDLANQRGSLSEEAFAKKRRDFEQQAMEAQRDVQARERSLAQGGNEAAMTLQKSIFEIINGIVQDRGITMVLSRQAVLILLDKSMDVTQEVLDRLNAKLPSVPVKIPPAKR